MELQIVFFLRTLITLPFLDGANFGALLPGGRAFFVSFITVDVLVALVFVPRLPRTGDSYIGKLICRLIADILILV